MTRVLVAGDPQRRKLDGIVAKIAALDEQIAAIEKAPLPLDEVRQQFANEVARLIQAPKGGSGWRWLFYPDGRRDPSFRPDRLTPHSIDHLIGQALQAVGQEHAVENLIACYMPDDYAPGLPAKERATKIAELRAQRRKLEIDEEREADRIERETGTVVLRRDDVDIDVLLQVWLEAT